MGRGVLTTSGRCRTLSPEGSAAVSLGKECKVDMMLKSGSKETGAVWATGVTGVGQLGCLAFNNCPVLLFFETIPLIFKYI